MSGALDGVRVVELAGLGPTPYAGMLLSDMGADVIRIDRPGLPRPQDGPEYALARGRRSIVVDMKHPDGVETVLSLIARADALVEGFRPGVTERLGIGPEPCLARNPALVYARMTGWGGDGPLSHTAGHDLNYLSLTGALTLLQRPGQPPATPPGFIADFAGGGLMVAFGIVCALLSARRTGVGQVIDASMVDGVASLTTLIYSMAAQDRWTMDAPGSNFCDGGSPYYNTYETADGRHLAVAATEAQFYAILVERLGLDNGDLADRDDPANWPHLKEVFADVFRSRTRDEWVAVFDGSDACVTPVLTFTEARTHPHNVARGTFAEAFGVVQPAPAPRLSRTPASIAGPPPRPGAHTREILAEWGVDAPRIEMLIESGAVHGSEASA